MRRRILGSTVFGVAVGAAATGTRTGRRMMRRGVRRGRAMVRRLQGEWTGMVYRIGGGTPDLMAGDEVLVDRVRSSLGPLLARLDLPHPNVMVIDGVAMLHGAVGTEMEKHQIEDAVRAVPGIDDVRSELHVGMGRGDTRPSEGISAEASPLLVALRQVAQLAWPNIDRVIGAGLSAFLARLPLGEREHVIGHLTEDVRELLDQEVVTGALLDLRSVDELITQVALAVPGIARRRLERIVPRIIGALRAAVPEEAADVRAVLPEGLRPLWTPVQIG